MSKTTKGLSEPVYRHILDLIMNKELKPGDRIPETKIAQEFNISRTPVREAMRQLANEGIIDIFPNRHAEVKIYNEDSIIEIGTLRVALDTLSIKLAVLFGNRAEFLELARIAKDCEQAYANKDSVLKKKLDCDFHLFLAQITNNELLMKYQKELYLRVQYILAFHANPLENERRHIKQHSQIAEALMNGDESMAISIIVDHLTSFYNLRTKYPSDFFDIYEP